MTEDGGGRAVTGHTSGHLHVPHHHGGALRNEEHNHESQVQLTNGLKNFNDSGQYYNDFNTTVIRDKNLFLA